MTSGVSSIVNRLREAGFEIKPLRDTHLWMVEGRGNMTTGQLIDLNAKLTMSRRPAA